MLAFKDNAMPDAPVTSYDFTPSSRLNVALERIGLEREPVIVVEEAARTPADLVSYAEAEVEFARADGPQGGYPGVRAAAPLNYVQALVKTVDPLIRRGFGLEQVKLARAECNFSIVTRAPEELAPLQRIPHVDTVDPLQFAILHYLCGPEHGGTAFYRHRQTGFETLTADRGARYEAARAAELVDRQGAGYIGGDTAHYQQTAAFAAKWNRLLIYRSRTLHSGQIPPGAALSASPRTGRLTANIFLNYRPI